MGKYRRLFLAFALLIVLGAIAWLLSQPREPRYQGKPLSYWLRGFNPVPSLGTKAPSTPSFQEALDAFQAADTNAIPLLLRWLRARDTDLQLKFVHLAQRQRLFPVNFMPAADRNNAAAWGFALLVGPRKPKPTNAVPALIQIYNENISESSQLSAAFSLGCFGPEAADAVPVLLPGLTHSDWRHRYQTLDVLGQIHARSDLCVPAITKALDDPDHNVRFHAAKALEQFSPDTNLQARIQKILQPTDRSATSRTNAAEPPK